MICLSLPFLSRKHASVGTLRYQSSKHRNLTQAQDKRKDGIVTNYISNNNIRTLEYEIKVFETKSTAKVLHSSRHSTVFNLIPDPQR